jgi:hypothetical protein
MKKIYSLPVLVERKLAELKPLKLQTERVTIKEAKIKPLKISLWHPKVKRNNISHQQVRE